MTVSQKLISSKGQDHKTPTIRPMSTEPGIYGIPPVTRAGPSLLTHGEIYALRKGACKDNPEMNLRKNDVGLMSTGFRFRCLFSYTPDTGV